MTTQLNKETREYLIKLVAAMAAWEYGNGHDDMADRFKQVLPNLVLYAETGHTILESPEELADMICQEYQDHIGELYTDSPEQKGEVTVVEKSIPDWISDTDALIGLK